jgi:hypothetical protein
MEERGNVVFFLFLEWSGPEATTSLLYQPRMMMDVEESETKVLGKNLPLCPPQIPHDLTWA